MSYKSSHTGAQIDAGVSAALNPDATPTLNSTNLVTSGGVEAKLSEKQDTLVFDNAPTSGSNNPVKSGGIYTALANKASNADLALKAPLDSPTFTGTPTAPTPTAGDDSTKVATTAFVRGEIDTADAALEQMILASFPTDTISNVPVASFSDGADGIPVKALTVNITPVQSGSGDPSPDNVRPISGWTGANVSRTNNLYSADKATQGFYYNESLVWTAAATMETTDYLSVTPGNTLYINFSSVSSAVNVRVNWFNASKVIQSQDVISVRIAIGTAYSLTVPSGAMYARISTAFASAPFDSIYNGIFTINLPFPTPPGAVYAGTLTDNGNGTWTLTITMATSVFGDKSWTKRSGDNCFITQSYRSVIKNPAITLCSMLTEAESPNYNNEYAIAANGDICCFPSTAYSSSTEFKTAFASAQFVYELATPQTYTLTAESVKTLLGQNNVFADTGDVAYLVYRADVGLYIAKKLAEA